MNLLVSNAIARGWVQPPFPGPCCDPTKAKHLATTRRWRAKNLAAGLTTEGAHRKQSYQRLSGFTPEQKRARRLAQQRAWKSRNHP